MIWLKQYALYLKAGVVLACLVWAGTWLYGQGKQSVELACMAQKVALAEAAVADMAEARKKEQAAAAKLAEIDKKHQQDLANAKSAADRVVADLTAGNLRLRQHWEAERATDKLSDAATAARWADEAAQLRKAAAGRIVQAGAECDAQVSGLQEVVKADRE